MRVLFWVFASAFFAGVLATVGLIVWASTPGAEMALIFFPPLGGLSALLGVVAVLVGVLGRNTLGKTEQRVGWAIGAALVLGVAGFAFLVIGV